MLMAALGVLGLVWSLLEGSHRDWSGDVVVILGAASSRAIVTQFDVGIEPCQKLQAKEVLKDGEPDDYLDSARHPARRLRV